MTEEFIKLPIGQLRSGELNELIKEEMPVRVTCWGNTVAYVIPAKDYEELKKCQKKK